ncbi:MAG TPA: amino acid adenylation domain-containing protein, partial [Thermoanaerobaculia bacterium]|nr:amino acid adenylation domain-containing protein [Thermoanaerobaculia bacterium]
RIEYLGRIDHQVKIRGFRIELGEIEAALATHPEVREAVVMAREDLPGDRRLIAYLVTEDLTAGEAIQAPLRAWLQNRLPEHMIPAAFVALPAFPLSPSGKVDRKALPAPSWERGDGPPAAPQGPIQELLAGIWRDVLRVAALGTHDSFFALGGHSLLAIRVMSRVHEVFAVDLPLRQLFETPTVAGLALHVEEARRVSSGSSAIPPLFRVDRGTALQASFSQERLWFLDRLGVTGPAYHLATALRLQGPLHVSALAAALQGLVRRHESLRTVFSAIDERVAQVVLPPFKLPLPVIDLGALPAWGREAELRRLSMEEARRLFDLARGPLVRSTLIALAPPGCPDEHTLLILQHHIISDGWSTQILLRELAVLYSAAIEGRPSSLPELPFQYADFADWQRRWLRREVLEAQTDYWRRRMMGAPVRLELPLDHPRPAVQSFRGAHWRFTLPARLAGELESLGSRQAASLFMTLLAGFRALLARWTGQEDISVGSPVTHRDRIELEGVVGFFINTLVLRTDLSDATSFIGLLDQVREVVLSAHDHRELPFERLLEALRLERDLSQSPLFQVMLLLQKGGGEALELPGLVVTGQEMDSGTAKFDLTLALSVDPKRGLFGLIEYNRDLFDATTISRLAGYLERLLEGVAAEPNRRLSDIPLLAEGERHQILREWNDTVAPFPRDLCLHQPFEARAAAAPDALAVIFEDQRLTYGEIERRANRLAHLLRSLGVAPGRLVAVHLERTPEMIVAVLGIHKAGGAYVPVEVSWPLDRLHYILESEGVAHVVTCASRLEALGHLPPLPALAQIVCLDEPEEARPSLPAALWTPGHLRALPEGPLPSEADPEDVAYIIFTSGSTGRPKGVMVRHRPAVNLIHWVNRRFRVGPADTVLFVTALSFDLSVYDIFGLLAAGGTVRMASGAELRDPEELVRILLREPVTFWDSAPATLQQLVRWLPTTPRPAALRLVFNSGDWIPVTLPDRVRQAFPETEFISLGGATEATIWSNFFPVNEVPSDWPSIPYGRPIHNARYHVLDAGLSPCPIGAPGDLYIAGDCLSAGYISSPGLTAEKYIPDPFGSRPGARLYRTGDQARYRTDGNLEFLGRVDTQVKIRGFRIELGEIESVLASHPAVREVVVLAREDTPGDQRLVAYVIPHGELPVPLALRRFAQDRLPEYMVPAAFVPCESWPLTPTGKLDRKALALPENARARSEADASAPPRTRLERAIAEIWKEVVGVAEVGTRDNFFDIGGHSLSMARVHARLEEALGRGISLVDLFHYPTIGSLAAWLEPAAEEKPAAVAVERVEVQGESVAVVGMAGRFPGARNVEELWRNLCGEVESIRFFTDEELR